MSGTIVLESGSTANLVVIRSVDERTDRRAAHMGTMAHIRVSGPSARPKTQDPTPLIFPRTAARMAGPLPAENTPLRSGENPIHSLMIDRSVAIPIPAGNPSNHRRNPQAS